MDDDPWKLVKHGDLIGLQRAVDSQKIQPATARDHRGATLLLWAAGAGHLDICRYLIESCQCDPNVPQLGKRSFRGRTALHWAARKGHVHIVEYLLEQSGLFSVEVDAATQDGTTAFHWAAWQAHERVLRILVQAKANVKHLNSYGCNAALWAAQGEGTAQTMEWLESVGCPTFLVNNAGHGVLHKAAQRGRKDVCEWFWDRLLENCSQTDSEHCTLELIGPDNDGLMPSDLAGMEGHEDLALFLVEKEVHLVKLVRAATEKCPPSWFSQAVVPSKQRIWEPWAGVARLKSAW